MRDLDPNALDHMPRRRHWLARCLTWKLWLPLAVLVLAATGALMYRESRLSAIPDLGDPFDVRAFSDVSIEPGENAWGDYEAAGTLLVPKPQSLRDDVNATLVGRNARRATVADRQPAGNATLAHRDCEGARPPCAAR